jgi:glycosyltransferase involved in cell wall biosynthesis
MELDVAFYAPWIAPLLVPGAVLPTGGAETQLFLLARGLVGAGHRVGLVTVPGDTRLPLSVDDVAVVVQPHVSSRPRLRAASVALGLGRALMDVRSPVVVQRAAGWTTGAVASVAKLTGARFVYSSASVIDFDYRRLEQRRARAALYDAGIRLADAIVVQSSEQEDLCRERLGREPVLIKSIAEPQPIRTAEPEAFLWVGRPTIYKRPLDYVRLAQAVPEARFRMVVVATGDDPLVRELRKEADGVTNLEFLTPRPRHELAELIMSTVAVVSTSDYEGMPNVFLEAWARGVPAFAFRHDPDGVIEREQVGSFAGGRFDRLVEQARSLWRRRLDQRELGHRCLGYVQRHHAPQTVIRQWESVLGLDGSPSPARAHTGTPRAR